MRYKVVPEPRGVAFLESARRAVPLVPDAVEDCCRRLTEATAISSRDAARDWLAFLEALELVEETPRGYRRRRNDLASGGSDADAADEAKLAVAFERRVFGAREVLDALESHGPLTADGAFEHLRERVPRWERERRPDWKDTWRERTRRLLEWSVAFELAARADGRYRIAERS